MAQLHRTPLTPYHLQRIIPDILTHTIVSCSRARPRDPEFRPRTSRHLKYSTHPQASYGGGVAVTTIPLLEARAPLPLLPPLTGRDCSNPVPVIVAAGAAASAAAHAAGTAEAERGRVTSSGGVAGAAGAAGWPMPRRDMSPPEIPPDVAPSAAACALPGGTGLAAAAGPSPPPLPAGLAITAMVGAPEGRPVYSQHSHSHVVTVSLGT